jgi:hypothetical protein
LGRAKSINETGIKRAHGENIKQKLVQ